MRLDIQQGTSEWLKLRKEKVTATDAGVILGFGYESPYNLWEKKMSLKPEATQTELMKRGQLLEPIAREQLCSQLGIKLTPAVVISDERPWQMASLDGLSDDNQVMVEIKCGLKTCEAAKAGVIPDYYRAQLQHQMCVMALPMMLFFTFDGHSSNIIEVKRDDNFIDEMIVKEHEFYKCIDNFEPPALTDRDYVIRNDEDWKRVAEMWLNSKELAKKYADNEEHLRQMLIDLAGSSNVKGAGVKVAKSVRKGSIDYKSISQLKEIDLESYRKKPVEYWRIGIE